MRKFRKAVPTFAFLIATIHNNSAVAAPDFSDTWIPKIINIESQWEGSSTIFKAQSKLTIETNANSVVKVEISFRPNSWMENPPNFSQPSLEARCEGQIEIGASRILNKTRSNSGNLYREEIVISTEQKVYSTLPLCKGGYRIYQLQVFDEANRFTYLSNNYTSPFVVFMSSDLWREIPAARKCKTIYPDNLNSFENCYNPIDFKKTVITVSYDLEAEAKAKAEAEAKAKVEAEAKAKAEAEAKAKAEAAKMKTTITCIKGKITKKVTAVNPKCPAGYKKK